jgi:peroxiredoxin
MKRTLLVALAVFLGAAGMLVLFREPIKVTAYDRLTQDMFVPADTDSFDPGPELGNHLPAVQAVHNGRRIQSIEEFAGPSGTLLVASRSLDWCPYCMRQMVQLQENKAAFDAAGISLVGITYDPPALQQDFAGRHGIVIPLLSDIDASTFKSLGILNEDYQPGESHYGIPHPGMIVLDSAGIVRGKLFLQAYNQRLDSAAALEYARQVLGLTL